MPDNVFLYKKYFVLINKSLIIGISIFILMLMFSIIGMFFVDKELTRIGAVYPSLPPSDQSILGSDASGRDQFAMLVYGMPNTIAIGLVAGAIGTLLGTFLGLVAGYYKGFFETIIIGAADVQLMIPILALLIVIATFISELNIVALGSLIALFSWAWPTRTIRSQIMSLRERNYVHLAKASGSSDFRIIFFELLPNILPFIVASFIGAVSAGILAGIGIQVIGLGPQRTATLGMMLYWSLYNSAIFRGMWWCWFPPVLILILIFIGLFLITIGLDQIANPRLRVK